MKKIMIAALLFSVLFTACDQEEAPTENEKDTVLGKISGDVYDADGGKSIPLVYITTKNSTHAVITDIDGHYELPEVRPGTYDITAFKQGYDTAYTSVKVDTGLTAIADFILQQTTYSRLRGSITDQSNDTGLVATISTAPFSEVVESNSDGTYSINNIKVGVYNVTAQKFGYETRVHVGVQVIADSTKVVDFELVPLFGIIEGRVTSNDQNNTPIVGANVSTNPATNVVTTDSLGYYKIKSVPELDQSTLKYTVTAQKAGYDDASIQVSVIAGKTALGDILMNTTSSP